MGVALGVGDFEGGVGEEFGVPVGGVEEVVVAGAQQGEVRELGRPAVFSGADVVALAPGRGAVAAGEPAVVAADDEGVVEGGGDGAGGGAVVQDGGASAGEDAV